MKILVADDSSFVRNIITKALKSAFDDVELLTSSDGQEAYTVYMENNPDLLITDLLMPNMTGQDLLRKLKSECAEVKAIVISADIQNATREELEEIGVVGFINKPMSPEKFAQLVELVRGQLSA